MIYHSKPEDILHAFDVIDRFFFVIRHKPFRHLQSYNALDNHYFWEMGGKYGPFGRYRPRYGSNPSCGKSDGSRSQSLRYNSHWRRAIPGYDRIQLSPVLSGTAQAESLALKDRHWYDIHNIELRTGEKIVSVNPREKSVFTDQGSCLHYDELVFATGSVPLRIPIPGANLDGVMTFRTLDDCETMGSLAETHTPIVVIGGGLLELEAANGLLSLGMEVTVVHGVKTLMERQLDSKAAKLLERELNRLGLKLELDRLTTRILGGDHVEGVEFADGTRILARHVVMAIGIRPNVEVAETAGLSLNRGIVVDDFMAISEPNIWAVGECAERNGILYGIVAPLYDQVEVLVQRLLNRPANPYVGSVPVTKLKISEVNVFSAGSFHDDENSHSLVILDSLKGEYRKAVFRDDRLVGPVLYGDTTLSARYSVVRRQASAQKFIESGLWNTQNSRSDSFSVASWNDEDVVCGCRGVSKGIIVNAVLQNDLNTIDQIRLHTGASRSCGSCGPLIAQLITSTTGIQARDDSDRLCACTDMPHKEIIQAIRTRKVCSITDMMRDLGWNNPQGCAKCRPALNYFRVFQPQTVPDDPRSRLVNERVHANIQKKQYVFRRTSHSISRLIRSRGKGFC